MARALSVGLANPHTRHPRCPKNAFTLVEMLVCLAIVALLTGLAAAGMARCAGLARRAACASQLRQIALAVCAYAEPRRAMPVLDRFEASDELADDPRAWRCPSEKATPTSKATSYGYLAIEFAYPSVPPERLKSMDGRRAWTLYSQDEALLLYKESWTNAPHTHEARFDGRVEAIKVRARNPGG